MKKKDDEDEDEENYCDTSDNLNENVSRCKILKKNVFSLKFYFFNLGISEECIEDRIAFLENLNSRKLNFQV